MGFAVAPPPMHSKSYGCCRSSRTQPTLHKHRIEPAAEQDVDGRDKPGHRSE
jgi:hypothetical protein